MRDAEQGETQQEFFDNFSKTGKALKRSPYDPKFQKPMLVTTSLEQIILAGILLILAACFVFFLGMLRGKAIAPAARPHTVAEVSPALVSNRPAAAVTQESTGRSAAPADVPRAGARGQETGKPYTIQLATYKRRDMAEKEAADLRRGGYSSLIVPNGGFFEVRAGEYANKEEAKKDLKFFASRYSGCYLRRR